MRDAIRNRFFDDLARLTSPRGNADVPGLLATWMEDKAWVTEVFRVGGDELDLRLGDLGREVYRTDGGRYASELRHNTRNLNAYWSSAEREAFLERHTALLFKSAFDSLVMDEASRGNPSYAVDFHGEVFLRNHRASGRGLLLLAANQGHPGPLLYHPALRSLKIGVIQHTRALPAGASHALTADGRVQLLPASVAGARYALNLLSSGQCVLLANDFIFPGVAAIRSILFGRSVMTSRAVVSLALRTRSTVLAVSMELTEPAVPRRYEVNVFPDLPLPEGHGPDATVATALAFGLITESLIRRSPEQWRLWNTLEYRWRAANEASR